MKHHNIIREKGSSSFNCQNGAITKIVSKISCGFRVDVALLLLTETLSVWERIPIHNFYQVKETLCRSKVYRKQLQKIFTFQVNRLKSSILYTDPLTMKTCLFPEKNGTLKGPLKATRGLSDYRRSASLIRRTRSNSPPSPLLNFLQPCC